MGEIFYKVETCVRQLRNVCRFAIIFAIIVAIIFAEMGNVQTNVTNFLAKILNTKNEVAQNFSEICEISYFREIEKAFSFQA